MANLNGKPRFRGKWVNCIVSSGAVGGRPNKLAAGMTNTLRRHKRGHSDDANTLAVKGTLDPLSGWYWNVRQTFAPARCPCCGSTHPNAKEARYTLSTHGRGRLARLRNARRTIERNTNEPPL